MAEIEETLINKKLDSYRSEMNDFQAENELTVKITLNEYRELISSNATKQNDIRKANNESYELRQENEKLKNQNQLLNNELMKYISHYGKLIEEESEES